MELFKKESQSDKLAIGAIRALIIDETNKAKSGHPGMNKWTFERLNRVEQALLLLSYSHYFYVEPAVDKGVVIDVAVKLAKTYLDASDYKFVNAILDKVLTRDGK